MKIIFAGTPDFAAISLRGLLQSSHSVSAVLTQPDRPAGRGRKAVISPVKALATEAQIPVLQPEKLDPKSIETVQGFDCDVMIVAAYGLIIPTALLNWPRFGCVNVHASLLPRWRGAAPIQRAIEAGDSQTGITIMQMDEGLDTGDMLNKSYLDISGEDNAQTLHDKLAYSGSELLLATLKDLEHIASSAQPQDNTLATYARKLSPAEGLLDWSNSAQALSRQIRAFTPWPGCYTYLNAKRIKILSASPGDPKTISTLPAGKIFDADNQHLLVSTGNGVLKVQKLQIEGKKAMMAKEIINGYPQWVRNQVSFCSEKAIS